MKKLFTFLFAALMSVGMWAEPITVTWNSADMPSSGYANSFTLDGVTITCGSIDWEDKNFSSNGTFTTDLGNFTKIQITADALGMIGDGWTEGTDDMTWTGNAASVSYIGDIMGNGSDVTFVFTIEPKGGGTAIDEVGQEPRANSQKLIKDGQLLIEKNGKFYNAQGAEVK